MSQNEIINDAHELSLVVTKPDAPDAGDPVRFGNLTGVAEIDENGDGRTTVNIGPAVYELEVVDTGGGGIAVGDTLFLNANATTLDDTASGYFFGFALEAISAGQTATIKVLVTPSPGSGALGSGTVGPSNLAANAVETAKIKDAAVTKAKLAGGFLKVALAAGTNSGANVTVAALAAADELVSVLSFTTAAAIATVADRTSEYAVGAGALTKAAGTDERNNQLVIIYLDLT